MQENHYYNYPGQAMYTLVGFRKTPPSNWG